MNREAIYSAFFAQLQTIAGLKTTSRKLRHWVDVPKEQMPALFLAQGNESLETRIGGGPQSVKLLPSVYLYVNTSGNTPPGSILNPLLDAIQAVIDQQHPVTGKNSLGGVTGVEWARIDGIIDTDEGTLGDLAVAIISVAILTTD